MTSNLLADTRSQTDVVFKQGFFFLLRNERHTYISFPHVIYRMQGNSVGTVFTLQAGFPSGARDLSPLQSVGSRLRAHAAFC
jgi:hypothetical protein